MPVNKLRKDTQKGEKPPGWEPALQVAENPDEQKEAELAAKEQEAIWEADEVGVVKWSGQDGKRFGD